MSENQTDRVISRITDIAVDTTYSFIEGENLLPTFEHRYHRDIAALLEPEVRQDAFNLLEEIFHMIRLYRENADVFRIILMNDFDQDRSELFGMTEDEIREEIEYSDRSARVLDMVYADAVRSVAEMRSAFALKATEKIYLAFIADEYKGRVERIKAYNQGKEIIAKRRAIIDEHSIHKN